MFYGSRAKELGRTTVPGECPSCGTANSVQLHVTQKYAHMMFIPLFPFGRKGMTRCEHCKQTLEGRHLSESSKHVMDAAKELYPTPMWMYFGLFLSVLLIPVGIWISREHDEQLIARLNAPKVGELYEVKLGYKRYTYYKVVRVSGDSIYASACKQETNKLSAMYRLLKEGDAAFDPELVGYSHADVMALQEDGTIIDVRDR
jgi:hypothetical protein